MNTFSSILKFKQKKLLGVFFYLLALQIILVSLTDKDLRTIASFFEAKVSPLVLIVHELIVLPFLIQPIVVAFQQAPAVFALLAVLTLFLVGLLAVTFVSGFLLSLVLRFFKNNN